VIALTVMLVIKSCAFASVIYSFSPRLNQFYHAFCFVYVVQIKLYAIRRLNKSADKAVVLNSMWI